MIYDISQSIYDCKVYKGDPSPKKIVISSMDNNDLYNLTAFSMCCHNGTHVDAPRHFIKDGKGIDQIDLNKFIGPSYVYSHEGNVTKEDAIKILSNAKKLYPGSEKRILIKGNALVTLDAARVFSEAKIDLLGNESQTIGPEDSPMAIHLILLEKEIVLLEGIRLSNVSDGAYFLNCAPINLNDSDGAPCRAILMDL